MDEDALKAVEGLALFAFGEVRVVLGSAARI